MCEYAKLKMLLDYKPDHQWLIEQTAAAIEVARQRAGYKFNQLRAQRIVQFNNLNGLVACKILVSFNDRTEFDGFHAADMPVLSASPADAGGDLWIDYDGLVLANIIISCLEPETDLLGWLGGSPDQHTRRADVMRALMPELA